MTDLEARMSANSPAAPDLKPKTIVDYVNDNVEQFERAIGDANGAELLARILLTEIRRTPKLAECSIQSFMGAAMQSAQMRLNPGPLGHCWLIPMKGQVEWWLGYQGMIELGYRSGLVTSFAADDVRHRDTFKATRGTHGELVHEIDYMCTDRGDVYAYYAHATLARGGDVWVVLRPEQVEEFRKRSPAAKAGSRTPWDTDYRAMALKTCVRQLFKWLPTTEGIGPALDADGAVSNWDPARPDVPPQPIDVDATDLYPDDSDSEQVD